MAKITDAAIFPGDGLVEATGICHPSLGSFRVFGSSYGGTGEPRERIAFKVEDSKSNDTLRRISSRGRIPTSKIHEYLEVKFASGLSQSNQERRGNRLARLQQLIVAEIDPYIAKAVEGLHNPARLPRLRYAAIRVAATLPPRRTSPLERD